MYSVVNRLARIMAMTGGLVLMALVILTCVSITGRVLNGFLHLDWVETLSGGAARWLIDAGVGPVNGDFEILEAGVAFAIFSFLPICQLYGAHATVDVFTSFLSERANRVIAAVWEVVLAGAIVLISWRLFEGFLDRYENGQTSWLLQFPLWWSYLASWIASAVAAIVGVYCAVARIGESLTGRPILPAGGTVE